MRLHLAPGWTCGCHGCILSDALVSDRKIIHGRFVFAALLTEWLASCAGRKLAINQYDARQHQSQQQSRKGGTGIPGAVAAGLIVTVFVRNALLSIPRFGSPAASNPVTPTTRTVLETAFCRLLLRCQAHLTAEPQVIPSVKLKMYVDYL